MTYTGIRHVKSQLLREHCKNEHPVKKLFTQSSLSTASTTRIATFSAVKFCPRIYPPTTRILFSKIPATLENSARNLTTLLTHSKPVVRLLLPLPRLLRISCHVHVELKGELWRNTSLLPRAGALLPSFRAKKFPSSRARAGILVFLADPCDWKESEAPRALIRLSREAEKLIFEDLSRLQQRRRMCVCALELSKKRLFSFPRFGETEVWYVRVVRWSLRVFSISVIGYQILRNLLKSDFDQTMAEFIFYVKIDLLRSQ